MKAREDGPLVVVKDLHVRLGNRDILRSVDMAIAPHEIVTVVGPNGSGKSTLLRSLIGAVRPNAGQVIPRAGLRLGYVPQKLAIDRTLPMTVGRFLGLPGQLSGPTVESALEEAGAAGLAQTQMAALSGGETQRVLLARALLRDPELLLLDEATQGLDQPGSAAFYQRIAALRQDRGCAVLMVSHELHVVMAASDRVICLNGRVCCAGAPEQVASDPEYHALFGAGTEGALALYRHNGAVSHDNVSGESKDRSMPQARR
ncbi:MAG: metal ABC transporter ATP-binding protein [Pseudomonadota bacterium]